MGWYYLFLGVFESATIQYDVAKIFGHFLFGRGWCVYACWTAMVLDLLPFNTPSSPRKHWRMIRYLVFVASLVFVSLLFILEVPNKGDIMWWSFIVGNIPLLCHRNFLGLLLQRQQSLLQIHLSDYRFFEAYEVLFSFPYLGQMKRSVFPAGNASEYAR